MKNWFSNLLSKSSEIKMENQQKFHDIFVEETPPQPAEETHLKDSAPGAKSLSKNLLEQFLEKNYQQMGYSDGYQGHSCELMEAKIRSIKSEYLQVIDRMIEFYQQEKHKLHMHMQEIHDLGDEFRVPVQQKLDMISNNILKLTQEKDYSIVEEGYIMQALNSYREGFLRGLKNYQNESILFNGQGLFNI